MSHARRAAMRLAEGLAFDEVTTGGVALLVTELSTNLVKHAGGGEIVLGAGVAGIEMLALDRGPGMEDVGRCLQDGYSTAGSPGTGLGAVRRLAHQMEVHSAPGKGTAVLARIVAPDTTRAAPGSFQVGAVCLPIRGEAEPGDTWAFSGSRDRALFLVADGLGHGALAARASSEAVRVFHDCTGRAPEEIVENIHLALRATRGAAVAVAEILSAEGILRFCGVGNVAAGAYSATSSRSFLSHNGTAGAQAARISAYDYPWSAQQCLVLHSDGLRTRWDLREHPGLLGHDPALVAGVLYRDHARGRDDVTVLVAREAGGRP